MLTYKHFSANSKAYLKPSRMVNPVLHPVPRQNVKSSWNKQKNGTENEMKPIKKIGVSE